MGRLGGADGGAWLSKGENLKKCQVYHGGESVGPQGAILARFLFFNSAVFVFKNQIF